MKIAVLGANGQLGSDCVAVFKEAGHDVAALTHAEVEVADTEGLERSLAACAPEVVVNTAAFHNVEKCEQEPDRAFAVNAIGARSLARLSNDINFLLVHISTDYVFDGAKNAPYVETDVAKPLNVYGVSKLAGERFIETIARRFFNVRVSGIYGSNPCRAKGGNNFVKLMLKLAKERGEVKVVDDEFVSPTYTPDAARQILRLLPHSDYGTVHTTANGSCSWHEFADAIFNLSKTKVNLLRAKSSDFPAKVPRPKYSVLDHAQLKKWDIDVMPHWRASLSSYLATLNG
jgi:dTDP-4-dehydrorhamnose reductase